MDFCQEPAKPMSDAVKTNDTRIRTIFLGLVAISASVLMLTVAWKVEDFDSSAISTVSKNLSAAILDAGESLRNIGQLATVATASTRGLTAYAEKIKPQVSQISSDISMVSTSVSNSVESSSASIRVVADAATALSVAATNQIPSISSSVSSTSAAVSSLMNVYSALPDRVAYTLKPSFIAIEPELTCRLIDGSGYGGCWHSRITGLLGEGVRVGGIFTQKFPELADSWVGISKDTHGFFDKYVQPHPMKVGDYFKSAGKITLGLGAAALRGGIF